jgi:uncharacterized repeat protein (TIGR02543 family)
MKSKFNVLKCVASNMCLIWLAVLITAFVFGACDNGIGGRPGSIGSIGEGTGTLTISISDNSRSVADIDITKLVHKIKATDCSGNVQTAEIKYGGTAHFSSLALGLCTINVEGWLGSELKSKGSNSVNIKSGPNGISIQMKFIDIGGKTYTVTFVSNGGSAVSSLTVAEGGTATRPANPTKSGFGFVNWYNNTGLAEPHYDFAAPVTHDITLYAKWSETFYTVKFESGGGSAVPNQTVGEGGTVSEPKPTRPGFPFEGWYRDPGFADLYDFDATVTGGITLYAKWREITLPITVIADIVPYLESWPANTAANPVNLPVEIALGTMTQATSGWRQILGELDKAGKYVELDLSLCAMTGTAFNPYNSIATGEDKIVSIILPDAAVSIPDGTYGSAAFRNFTALESFSGAGLTTIGSYSFNGRTNLALTELPEGIISIGTYAFSNCKSLALTSLPEGLTSISSQTFSGCESLALTSLPEGLETIGSFAFDGCTNLAFTFLPEGITTIENTTFQNCTSLALTSLPEGIIFIGDNAFLNCISLALTSLPEGVTSIGNQAFRGCTGITQITLPEVLISMENFVFAGCTYLTLVTCLATTPPDLGTSVFAGTASTLQIKVPASSVDDYKTATNWSSYTDRISAMD